MDRTGGHLKDDGIGQLNVPGIAVGLNAHTVGYGGDSANGCAQRQRRRFAEGGEVAERHDVVSLSRQATKSREDTRQIVARSVVGIVSESCRNNKHASLSLSSVVCEPL